MKLITLAKKLDFTTETEYFDYCIDSHMNGNYSQCERLFKDMTKIDRKSLVRYINGSGMLPADIRNVGNFYFNLL